MSASPCYTQKGGSGYRLDRASFVLDMGVFANCQGSTSFRKFRQKCVMEAKKTVWRSRGLILRPTLIYTKILSTS